MTPHRLGALLLVWSVGLAGAQAPPAQEPVAFSPEDPKIIVRVGQVTRFRGEIEGDEALRWQWTFDGRTVSTGPQWTFVPAAEDSGGHEVAAAVTGPAGTVRRHWRVRVAEPRPPRIVEASPSRETVTVEADSTVRLQLRAAPAGTDETVTVTWTVDGVPAGTGEALRLTPDRAGVLRARALATASLGAAVSREWRITVTPRPTTTTTLALAARPPRTEPEPPPPPPPTLPPPPPTLPAPRPPTVPPQTVPPATAPPAASRGIDPSAVRALLDRYAAAWQARDIGALRRLGQVTSDAQAKALDQYFEEAQDLQVELDVLEIRAAGDRAIVRFRRRDRFRNPAGQVTTQQSPPIEKEVVRTPDGTLRFGVPGG